MSLPEEGCEGDEGDECVRAVLQQPALILQSPDWVRKINSGLCKNCLNLCADYGNLASESRNAFLDCSISSL